MSNNTKNINLTFRINKNEGQAPLLPQAEIIRGVAGSVLAVQVANTVYAVDMLAIVSALTAEETMSAVSAPFATEEKAAG